MEPTNDRSSDLKQEHGTHSDSDDVHTLVSLPKLDDRTPPRLLRKVDLRLMPIMLACYTLQFIDKGILNYANIMGIQKDTHLHGDQFSWLATAFFIVFALVQIPGIYVLSKVPVNIYLGCGMLLCAIGVACTAACNSYASLLTVRIILAVGEATMSPSLSLVTMKWYTKQEASRRYGIWYSGLGVGQIIGGLISFGFQHVKKGSFGSWRGMFLVCGLLNLIVAAWTFFSLTDNPSEASFLTPAEQSYFTARLLHVNKYHVSTKRFTFRQVRSTLTSDLSIWLAVLVAASCSIQSGAIGTFSSALITGFGYSPKQAALLNMPSGAVSIVSCLAATWFVENKFPRSLAILCLVAPAVTGASLMSFAHQKGALLAGIWMINSVTPILIVVISWTQANCAGHTKRVTYNAMMMIAFGIGNICGPQTFRAKDAPKFWPARVTMVAATGTSGLLTIVLLGLYVWRNRTRRAGELEDEKRVYDERDEKTDFEITGFRYVY
ncbi:putative MFS transporter [Cristinia sonorae]|uniref:MFS transporter n=1 Tax=Cristinia sonorae TaxID=1940300 RepID=A0A8K0UJ55_9AGAR|nr:putative MFS transporter [Cristinia sonorae]